MADQTPSNAPRLRLPSASPTASDDASSTTSPARGAEMRNFLQARLQKNRAPPLVHSWDFYHDRQDRTKATNLSNVSQTTTTDDPSSFTHGNGKQDEDDYSTRLEHLAIIDDVRKFWNVFNNFDTTHLVLRDSIHLFHHHIRPIWEDPRNLSGGSWTFRVPKSLAPAFWQEICLLAIGEQLQTAVEEEGRKEFRDDICGVSLGIWNRDGGHEDGIQRVLGVVMEALSEDLKPREGSFYYKRHSEHAGYAVPEVNGKDGKGSSSSSSRPGTSTGASIDAVLAEGGS
ncbi:hypothetical protein LTR78_000516 [Recurvomyces mirabilis]|uniref:Translation initiation factor eIF4e n=1 Tax=Recurvomyces mirabilis TaxID=574656 RepID=A0AAE0WY29_9PEZI|nr:hypothetical protein LTR78_000516 [Recurvomyces mirabilis]KAK5162171.1 hypothetical protein LTS14_000517 [Recurvomyces mirabilis]